MVCNEGLFSVPIIIFDENCYIHDWIRIVDSHI